MINLLITFTASFLVWIMVFGVIAFLYKNRKRKIQEILSVIISPLLAVVFSWTVKLFIPYANRPFRINGFPPLTLTVPVNTSFPSDHTAFSFALAVSIFLYNKKFGFLLLILALVVGAGRVFGNVHYPVDILGGAILGTFSALLVDLILQKVSKK